MTGAFSPAELPLAAKSSSAALHVPPQPGTNSLALLQGGAEGFLGRSAGGTCFAFSPSDPRTYLVGTEEGGVHKCSTAFTEQYTRNYSGHLAPVYQVQ